MMEYAYYPGCSLETTGKPYDMSVREVFKALNVGLHEIEDWNCCGATMYMSVNKLVGYAISARNLALAKNMGMDVCAPCSSCYTILRKTNRHVAWDPYARKRINEALSAADLSYDSNVEVRHPLDILVNDVGIETIAQKAPFRLNGVKVAPYYGCQIVRPHGFFDDVDEPTTMDRLLSALGAEVIEDYPNKVRCCGGMLMTTYTEIAENMNEDLLKSAVDYGANVIATACPLCQMNLEGYQPQINKRFNAHYKMPIVYFSQLVGLALGIDQKKLGLDTLLVDATKIRVKSKDQEVLV
jgi:heterodisulfide reductase subunit B